MARKKRKRIASRGSVNNIILKSLVDSDKYGYEIIKDVEKYSDGKITLKQPSLYSSLSRFEEKKFVTSYWGDSDIGGRRHYYHLTNEGLSYYKKVVLKESDTDNLEENLNIIEDESLDITNDVNIDDDIEKTYEIDNNNYSENNEKSASNNTNILDNLDEQFINTEHLGAEINESKPVAVEVDEDTIPSIIDFNTDRHTDDNIIPDHQFFHTTPIESIIDKHVSENNNNIITSNSPWIELANKTKETNQSFAKNYSNKLFIKKPKKSQKVILDKDGIYKLRDEDYNPSHTTLSKNRENIIDNVITRTKDSTIYGYSMYSEPQNKHKSYSELTEEEKKERNENFLAKFNLLTKSKMKPVSAPIHEEIIEKKSEKPIDYRGKLNAIIESANEIQSSYEDDQDSYQENNLFNYKDDDEWSNISNATPSVDNSSFDEEDNFIDFEPVQEFQPKTVNNNYVDDINNYSAPINELQINRYENRSKAVLSDKTFVLINKLKFVFGIIMSLLMLIEVSSCFFLFKNSGLYLDSDKIVFILSYVAIGIFACLYILPYCFNTNEHKVNNFRFKYSFWFGILTFIVSAILIYCFNALMGFELDNIKYFTIKLIVPIIMCFNFIIGPVIYLILNTKKWFYD